MKYLLFVIIVFILWLTAPMWQAEHRVDKSVILTDEEATLQKESMQKNISKDDLIQKEKEKKFAEKFGRKPRVDHDSDTPYVVKSYWKKIYKYPESIIPMSCTPLKMSSQGWQTICNYKTMENQRSYEIQQDIYYIDHNVVTQR